MPPRTRPRTHHPPQKKRVPAPRALDKASTKSYAALARCCAAPQRPLTRRCGAVGGLRAGLACGRSSVDGVKRFCAHCPGRGENVVCVCAPARGRNSVNDAHGEHSAHVCSMLMPHAPDRRPRAGRAWARTRGHAMCEGVWAHDGMSCSHRPASLSTATWWSVRSCLRSALRVVVVGGGCTHLLVASGVGRQGRGGVRQNVAYHLEFPYQLSKLVLFFQHFPKLTLVKTFALSG